MEPINFKNANFTYTAPNDMPECKDLVVYKGKDMAGYPVIISKWQLSKEDLEYLNKTGTIYLQITGNGMPPVSLFVEDPFSRRSMV